MQRIQLTQNYVDQILPTSKDAYYFDQECSPFYVRVYASGRKTYNVRFQYQGMRQNYCLGDVLSMSLEQARKQAYALVRPLYLGEPKPLPAITLDDYMPRFFHLYARNWKPNTFKANQSAYRLHVQKKLGKLVLKDIKRHHIEQWFLSMVKLKGTANRTLPLLSLVMQYAEKHGYRHPQTNPCKGFKRYKTKTISRFLNEEQMAHLWQVLEEFEAEHFSLVQALRLLMLTGARCQEITALTWSCYREGHLYLKDSKTGAKTIFLSEPARKILDALERDDEAVFPKLYSNRSYLHKIWSQIRQQGDLTGYRLHDLRHSYASFALKNGCPLLVLSRLLGHVCTETTLKYTHLEDQTLQERISQVASVIQGGLTL